MSSTSTFNIQEKNKQTETQATNFSFSATGLKRRRVAAHVAAAEDALLSSAVTLGVRFMLPITSDSGHDWRHGRPDFKHKQRFHRFNICLLVHLYRVLFYM